MSKLKTGQKVIIVSTGDAGVIKEIDYYEDGDIETVHVKLGATKLACSPSELLTHRGAYRALQASQERLKATEQRERNAARKAADANLALIKAGLIPVAVLRPLIAQQPRLSWSSQEDVTISYSDTTGQRPVWFDGSLDLSLRNSGEFGNEYLQEIGEALR